MASYLKESLRQALKDVQQREGQRQGGRAAGGAPVKPPAQAPIRRATPTPPQPPPRPVARAQPPAAPPAEQPPRAQPVPRPSATVSLNASLETSLDEPHQPAQISMNEGPSAGAITRMAMAFDRPVITAPPPTRFRPLEPRTLEAAGLDEGYVEGLVLKYLVNNPTSTTRQIANDLALFHRAVSDILDELKRTKQVEIKRSTATGDFQWELTSKGRNTVVDLNTHSRYVGPAPVPLEQYLLAVREQSIANETPRMADLKRAFQDLLVPEELLQQLGPAMTSGKGLFLFGFPGNGKTSLAERMTRAFGTSVYLPHAVLIHGTLVKVFDPMVHEPLEEDAVLSSRERPDRRWVKCRRPTVVAGGELTMSSLEIEFDERTGICEAPLQLKANCGTLVIDDFGRQKMEPAVLLNRWIVPLEQRVDYLSLHDGRKVRVPFDPLLVFSTNLDPKDLCDEAFLRRIPYKICVEDPNELNFRTLLHIQSELMGFEPNEEIFDDLIERHYRKVGRRFRNCHPRDLVLQIQNQCVFREKPLELTKEAFDEAVDLYFTLL